MLKTNFLRFFKKKNHNRARSKSGLKIIGATSSSDSWNVSFEKENPKQTVARVTVYKNEQETESTQSPTETYADEYEYVYLILYLFCRICNFMLFIYFRILDYWKYFHG